MRKSIIFLIDSVIRCVTSRCNRGASFHNPRGFSQFRVGIELRARCKIAIQRDKNCHFCEPTRQKLTLWARSVTLRDMRALPQAQIDLSPYAMARASFLNEDK